MGHVPLYVIPWVCFLVASSFVLWLETYRKLAVKVSDFPRTMEDPFLKSIFGWWANRRRRRGRGPEEGHFTEWVGCISPPVQWDEIGCHHQSLFPFAGHWYHDHYHWNCKWATWWSPFRDPQPAALEGSSPESNPEENIKWQSWVNVSSTFVLLPPLGHLGMEIEEGEDLYSPTTLFEFAFLLFFGYFLGIGSMWGTHKSFGSSTPQRDCYECHPEWNDEKLWVNCGKRGEEEEDFKTPCRIKSTTTMCGGVCSSVEPCVTMDSLGFLHCRAFDHRVSSSPPPTTLFHLKTAHSRTSFE